MITDRIQQNHCNKKSKAARETTAADAALTQEGELATIKKQPGSARPQGPPLYVTRD